MSLTPVCANQNLHKFMITVVKELIIPFTRQNRKCDRYRVLTNHNDEAAFQPLFNFVIDVKSSLGQTTQNFIVVKAESHKNCETSAMIREISDSNLETKIWGLPNYPEEFTARNRCKKC